MTSLIQHIAQGQCSGSAYQDHRALEMQRVAIASRFHADEDADIEFRNHVLRSQSRRLPQWE